jgi:ComF family protein
MPASFSALKRFAATRLHAAFPSSCALCGNSCGDGICNGCQTQFFGQMRARCQCCAIPLPPGANASRCGNCLRRPPAFDASTAATDYAAPIDRTVLALKFGAQLALAPLFARLLHETYCRNVEGAPPHLLLAVPLGAQRLAERGFNQAIEIARPLARRMKIPLAVEAAVRTRETTAQALLHPDQRKQNIRHAFTLSTGAANLIRGKHVGVVDDVMTTGETLNELAAVLKRFGATRITNLVFARTVAN